MGDYEMEKVNVISLSASIFIVIASQVVCKCRCTGKQNFTEGVRGVEKILLGLPMMIILTGD